MYTRRLNQDCLENFFGKVRQQNGNCRNPTPIQFTRSFKKLFALDFFNEIDESNCLEDFDNILINATSDSLQNYQIFATDINVHPSVEVEAKNYLYMELPEKSAFTYICGYLLKNMYP